MAWVNSRVSLNLDWGGAMIALLLEADDDSAMTSYHLTREYGSIIKAPRAASMYDLSM